jgi:hypothetical protein
MAPNTTKKMTETPKSTLRPFDIVTPPDKMDQGIAGLLEQWIDGASNTPIIQ